MNNMYKNFANAIRCLSVDMVHTAKSGHQGAPLGFSDVMSILWNKYYRRGKDRIILSNGHASAMLYSSMYLSGGYGIEIDDLKNFRKINGKLQGHPERDPSLNINITTGALGQGLGSSVGIALALKKRKYNDGKVFVICGDGDLMEGISHESMTFASSNSLDNLIVLFDNNDICIDGHSSNYTTDNIERFKAYGFEVFDIDGHNYEEIDNVFKSIKSNGKPIFISFRTVIGKYSKTENSNICHGNFLNLEDIKNMRRSFGFDEELFSIPHIILNEFREYNSKNHGIANNNDTIKYEDFNISDLKKNYTDPNIKKSTRSIFKDIIKECVKRNDRVIGGSADLSESTCCYDNETMSILSYSNNWNGNYIHYGIREHAMASIMNGLCSEGFIPYGGTFLVFSDYMRPSIRNAALMKLGVIYILTHDSIAVGEDGATHQPIEHIDSLRSIPNLCVMRPCSGMEVIECVEYAINNRNRPSAIILSRQNLENCVPYQYDEQKNMISFGMYEIYRSYSNNNHPKFSIIASGSEVPLSINLARTIEKKGIGDVRVISAVSIEIFEEQNPKYKDNIITHENDDIRIIIEAGRCQSLEKYKREGRDIMINIDKFGRSGNSDDLMKFYGFDVEKILEKLPI